VKVIQVFLDQIEAKVVVRCRYVIVSGVVLVVLVDGAVLSEAGHVSPSKVEVELVQIANCNNRNFKFNYLKCELIQSQFIR
jgi:hypothetical protein